jgi:hypothetical protein
MLDLCSVVRIRLCERVMCDRDAEAWVASSHNDDVSPCHDARYFRFSFAPVFFASSVYWKPRGFSWLLNNGTSTTHFMSHKRRSTPERVYDPKNLYNKCARSSTRFTRIALQLSLCIMILHASLQGRNATKVARINTGRLWISGVGLAARLAAS